MSIYSEITEAIDKDIYGEIPEIEVSLSITSSDVSDYDPVTGVITKTETENTVRAIKIEDNVGENIDLSTKSDTKRYLIMNDDLNGLILKKNMIVNNIYSIEGIEGDPIGVSWIITCRLSKNV